MATGGRVSDAAAKKLIAKELSSVEDAVSGFDLETGQIKSKKAKKEKSPQQQAHADLKQFDKKILPIDYDSSALVTMFPHQSIQARIPNILLLDLVDRLRRLL